MYWIDRHGFNVLAKEERTPQEMKSELEHSNQPIKQEWIDFRMPFPYEITKVEEVFSAFDNALQSIRL